MNSWTRYLPRILQTKIDGFPALEKVIGNTSWLFLDKIIRMGVGLFVTVWIARYLGPAQLGLLEYSLAFVALFSGFASLGLDGIVVRELVSSPGDRDEIIASAFALKLLAGFASFIMVIVAIMLLRHSDLQAQIVITIVAVGLILQSADVVDFWFQSQVLSKYTVYARNAAFLLFAGVKILLILQGAPLLAFVFALVAEAAVAAVGLLLVFYKKEYRISLGRISLLRCKHLLRDSWPLIIASLSIVLYMKIDQVMLGEMAGAEAVGIYSAALKLSEVWYFIPMAITSSVFPFIIQAKAGDPENYRHRLAQLFGLMTALAIAIVVPITIFANPLVGFIYGDSFVAAGPVLAVHIWACWFVFLGLAQDPWDMAENLTRFAMTKTIIGAVLNIVLNTLMIPKFGVVGAAAATVVSSFVTNVLLNVFHIKARKVFILQMKSVLFLREFRRTRGDLL